MATFKDLEQYLQNLPDQVMEDAAEIVAETATAYFKETFTTKEFDGNPWQKGVPKKTGSLMVESGNLMNSIHPAVITPERVVISAGNNKVNYARTHNEGFSGTVTINPFTRKNGQQVKAHTRRMNIPRRQFMGRASELAGRIISGIENYLNKKL
ncbi:MAG: hypothetical protein PWQ06_2025 [Anaerophaga sp.]|nr:hypothetical protein [Anaerophaga sp.]